MGWRRNLAQRLAKRAQSFRERALEIRPGTPLARGFAGFGADSVIEGPQLRLVGTHAMRVGAGVTILTNACLEAYAGPGSIVLEIGDGCYFSHHLRIVALNGVFIGRETAIGTHVTVTDTVHDFKRGDSVTWQAPLVVGRPLRIGSGVWIGHGVVVNGGVTIGDGSIVGPNSVIARDVPPGVVVTGNPPVITRRRHPETGVWEPVPAEPLTGVSE